jgi:serpin B
LLVTDKTLSLAIANSVWYDQDKFIINNDFVNLSKTWFDAPATGLDYASPNALATVNKWCEDNTNGLIRDMLGDLKDVEILNALYFKGNWSYGYDFNVKETSKQSFTKSNGETAEVDMMYHKYSQNKFLKYYKDEYLSLVSIPYGNKACNMYFVLPSENSTFDEMTEQLLVSGYWSQVTRAGESMVEIYIPKFELKYENKDIKTILSQMGMGVAYNSATALFPHIANNANFYIARSTQKTYIRIDEKGTEAAAVSEQGLMDIAGLPSGPAVFRADRPFLFVIQENSTGTILFMGKIGNPVE